jgi:hypothetical protein
VNIYRLPLLKNSADVPHLKAKNDESVKLHLIKSTKLQLRRLLPISDHPVKIINQQDKEMAKRVRTAPGTRQNFMLTRPDLIPSQWSSPR